MVQVKRRYDARSRRARAEQTRDAVVSAARELFLSRGFAATTVAEVARASEVSVEYVYKGFGGKAGLVRSVVIRALEGSGAEPAESRSDALTSANAAALIHGWGRLAAEVAPLVAPVLLLVRTAAVLDTKAATLSEELDETRRARMHRNARRLVDSGDLRDGIDLEHVADVLWTFSSAELYDLLVVRRGWAPARYGDFVARGIAGELLVIG